MNCKQPNGWQRSREKLGALMGTDTPDGRITITIPNMLTLARMAMVPVFWFTFFSGDLVWQMVASLLFIVGAVTDLIDGKLARKWNQVTPFGGFADPIADKVFVLAGYWAILIREDLGIYFFTALIWVAVISLRELLVTIRRVWVVGSGSAVTTTTLAKVKTGIALSSLIALFVLLNLRDYLALDGSLPALLTWLKGPWFALMTNVFFFFGFVPTVVSGFLYMRDATRSKPKENG